MKTKKNIPLILCAVIAPVIIVSAILINVFYKDNKISDKTHQEIFYSNINDVQAVIQYPNYNELFFSGGKGYEFKNHISNKLIIHLGGSGWDSAIGIQMTGEHMADLLLSTKDLTSRYTFFFPEKFDRKIGVDYRDDINEWQRYTLDNLIDNYYNVISEYLSVNNYESIIIIGSSEGATVLPILYDRLNNPNIKALISFAGGGGLSRYDQYQVTFNKLLANDRAFGSLTEDERNINFHYFETRLSIYKTEPYPDSPEFIDDHPESMTYRYVSSGMRLKLFEYYEKINIPILFMHGELDTNVPVETTRYIETSLPDKPFEYIYYPNNAHGTETRRQYRDIQGDIIRWVLEIDK